LLVGNSILLRRVGFSVLSWSFVLEDGVGADVKTSDRRLGRRRDPVFGEFREFVGKGETSSCSINKGRVVRAYGRGGRGTQVGTLDKRALASAPETRKTLGKGAVGNRLGIGAGREAGS
jgi:hypothetical protein